MEGKSLLTIVSLLLSQNEEKVKKLFGKYFTNKSDKLFSDYLMHKEKTSSIEDEYLTKEDFQIFKNLGNNLIVSGVIQKVHKENSKNILIEVKLDKVLAICYDGESLIDAQLHKSIPSQNYIAMCKNNFKNIFNLNIIGLIKKHDMYDNKIPHLNDDIDSNLQENNYISCLVVKNKLQDNEGGSLFNAKMPKNEFISLSLKNSLIKNSKQLILVENNMNILLGMNYFNNTLPGLGQLPFVNDSSLKMNENILRNLIGDLKIDEYDNLQGKLKLNKESGFSYEKIRKVQNYDWADEYIKKGILMIESKCYEKAIEHLNDAEKLDSLNKEIYSYKGYCYTQINQYEKAKKEYKTLLSIDPDDEEAKNFILFSKGEKSTTSLLNKKRINYK